MTYKIYLSIFLVLSFFSCSDRERNNPLDPNNPVTKGRITGVSISSREDRIYLSWSPLVLTDLDSIRVYKKQGSGSFKIVESLARNSSSFVEENAQYGESYSYYVTAIAGDYESPASDSVSVNPGPTYLWIGDLANGYFSRFSHDLSTALFRFGVLRYPKLIAVSPKERSAWCYSLFSDAIYKLDENGNAEVSRYDLGRITDISADLDYKELWIAQLDSGLIRRLDRSGNIETSSRAISSPKLIKADSRRHSAWIIDDKSGQIFRMTRAGFLNAKNQVVLENPVDLSIDQNSSDVWVADGYRVIKLNFVGEATGIEIPGFNETQLIDFDNSRNILWVVDKISSGYSLIKLGQNGERIFQLDNFDNPVAIDVNEYDGSCMVADPGKRAVFKVSESGEISSELEGYVSPQVIAVEHH